MSLYLTPTRLRLMHDIHHGWVYAEGRGAYNAGSDRKVACVVEELIDAGYVYMPENPRRDTCGRALYALTDVGLAELTLRLGSEQS